MRASTAGGSGSAGWAIPGPSAISTVKSAYERGCHKGTALGMRPIESICKQDLPYLTLPSVKISSALSRRVLRMSSDPILIATPTTSEVDPIIWTIRGVF